MPESPYSVIQYWDYYATLGVALHRAQKFGCRYRIFKVVQDVPGGAYPGMWKAVHLSDTSQLQ